jgi:cell division protein FtsB
MLKRITATLVAFLITGNLFAQDVAALEARVREMARQIEVLTQEIEALKTRQTEPKAEAATTESQYGLGAAASKVYRAESGVSIGGYGEFLYQNNSAPGELATADSLRAVVYTGYKFNDRVLFNSELEVEHANLERGGNVELEFAYLDYLIRPEFNVRGGLVLLPIGLTNEQHEPTAFLGARRPVVEQHIIPSTWSDLGAGVFGDVGRVSYRGFLVTGLNASGFGPEEGIREGRQAGGEATAEDWAAVARVDWHPIEGTMFGGSLYRGDSGQGGGFDGGVTLGEVHAQAKLRGVTLRALATRGSIGDAAAINGANGLTGEESVGSRIGGWYLEGGYEIGGPREMSFIPYARYEQLDTQRRVPAGFLRNPENDQTILTLGVAFRPISQTVLKLDWQDIDNAANTGSKQWNVSLGYIF